LERTAKAAVLLGSEGVSSRQCSGSCCARLGLILAHVGVPELMVAKRPY